MKSVNGVVGNNDYFIPIGGYIKEDTYGIANYYFAFVCQFIHSGPIHLLLNMTGLYYISIQIKGNQSAFKSFTAYILGIIFVGAGLLLFAEDDIVYLGNSGAICALAGLWTFHGLYKKGKKAKEEIESLTFLIIASIMIPPISLLMHMSGIIAGGVFLLFEIIFCKFRKIIIRSLF
mgnify:CR=1 FL=1